jgi:hypothetical protein
MENIKENIKDTIENKVAIAGNPIIDIKKATQMGMKSNANQQSTYAMPIGKTIEQPHRRIEPPKN